MSLLRHCRARLAIFLTVSICSAAASAQATVDLATSVSNDQSSLIAYSAVNYTVAVRNEGPDAAVGARILGSSEFDALRQQRWTCSVITGAQCPAAGGDGALDQLINLPAGASLRFIVSGTAGVLPGTALAFSARADVAAGDSDANPGNNASIDSDPTFIDTVFRSSYDDCDGVGLTGLAAVEGSFFSSFPNPLGNFRSLNVPVGQFRSAQFNGLGGHLAIQIETAEFPGEPGGPVSLSVSTCRGDFRPQVLNSGNQRCLHAAMTNQASLTLTTMAGIADTCAVLPGTTYWLNVAHVAAPYDTPAGSTCLGPTACSLLIRTSTFGR